MTDDKTPFGWGAIVAAAILGGLAPAVASPFIVDWIKTGVDREGLDGFWTPVISTLAILALLAIAFLFVLTFLRRSWRERIWVPFGLWVAGTWPVTTRRLKRETLAADAAGYSRRDHEVSEERSRARRPSWTVDQKPHMAGDDTYWLTNHGYGVSDVRVSTDSAEMVFDHAIYFPGQVGTNTAGSEGKQFDGRITEKGKADGVTFNVEWIDQHGDACTASVFLPPDRLTVNTLETREDAYARGRSDLQAEMESAKKKPPKHPRWAVGQKTGGTGEEWVVLNTSDGAVARDVTLNASPSYFQFLGDADWEDLTGPAHGEFRGRPSEGGGHLGVDFLIEWTGSDEQRYTGSARWDRGFR